MIANINNKVMLSRARHPISQFKSDTLQTNKKRSVFEVEE
jgi:hypothetical protein